MMLRRLKPSAASCCGLGYGVPSTRPSTDGYAQNNRHSRLLGPQRGFGAYSTLLIKSEALSIAGYCGRNARRRAHYRGSLSACNCSTRSVDAGGALEPHRLVFLGTPEAAAIVLRKLLIAAKDSQQEGGLDGRGFEVAAVVTRPSKRKTHGKVLEGSPVSSVALELGMSEEAILSPQSAKTEDFLSTIKALEPSLCITAAYGNVLPQAFLDIPKYGTVNIHPSELPYFRGPAPVQRAMMRGDRDLCVSLAFTVLKMDAGRIVSQKWLTIDDKETSDVALSNLFELGSDMLLENMSALLDGTAMESAKDQDDDLATHAPKLSKQEGVLDPHGMTASQCHDICCALSVWPGTSMGFTCLTPIKSKGKAGKGNDGNDSSSNDAKAEVKEDRLTIKVSETSVEGSLDEWDSDKMAMEVGNSQMCKGRKATDMLIVCKNNTLLRVGSIQLPGKKAMQPKAFFNGRKGATLSVKEEVPV